MNLPGKLFGFLVVGSIGFFTDAAILLLLTFAGLNVYIARIFSFLGATLATWLLNRFHTFRHQRRFASSSREYRHYLAVQSIGGAINYLVFSTCIFLVPEWKSQPLYALAIASIVAMFFNFAGANWWVFANGKTLNSGGYKGG